MVAIDNKSRHWCNELIMKIEVTSVIVDDQDKALKFYTEGPGLY